MAKVRIYNSTDHPDHYIVKAAMRAGLTNVVVTWNSTTEFRRERGWNIVCDQRLYRRFYQNQVGVVRLIRDGLLTEKGTGFLFADELKNQRHAKP